MNGVPVPNLDDRDFEALVDEALGFVRSRGGEWSDLGPGDPGVVLLESFAYLTDLLLFRLNRVPEKARIEFLRLLGTEPYPPAAAQAEVELTRADGSGQQVVPQGTRVRSLGGADSVELVTAETVHLGPGPSTARVVAHHVTQIRGELLGASTGEAGQVFALREGPVVRPTGHELDLLVGVELASDGEDRPDARVLDGKAYERWEVVETFGGVRPDARVCRVDRVQGLVTFAPAVRTPAGGAAPMAAVPAARREIRAWYRTGGGPGGNVAAGALRRLEPVIEGVEVTNPARAVGGEAVETVPAALLRARESFHEPRRAVTADDFEALARRLGGIARASAITASEAWAHASPGTVDVRLVPSAPGEGPPTAEILREREQADLLGRAAREIARNQPLGVRSDVQWCRYKPVTVQLRVVVGPAEDPAAVRERVAGRLRRALSPVPLDHTATGWPFGRALRASNVFDLALKEQGVRWADSVVFEVHETPDGQVAALAADRHQPGTWFAGDGASLYRSQNHAAGWELIHVVDDGQIERVVTADDRPGAVAIVVTGSGGASSRVYVSLDCGQSFAPEPVVTFSWSGDAAPHAVRDLVWLPADGPDDLLLATDRGLYRLRFGDAPRPWQVDPNQAGRGVWAVAAAPTPDGDVDVVVALMQNGGVHHTRLGRPGGFRADGLTGADVRRLVIERRELRRIVWAPTYAVGNATGDGCHRGELLQDRDAAIDWSHLGDGWDGGICHDLAFVGDRVLAASQFNGVLVLDGADRGGRWRSPSVAASGLPLNEQRRFEPTTAIAAQGDVVLAGTDRGVFRTRDGDVFELAARRHESDVVTLPPGWLFVSGEHQITVEFDREGGGGGSAG